MFSQKKRVPWGWIAIVIVLAAFGFLMIFAALTDDSDPQEGENNNMPQQNVQSDQKDDANTDNDGNGEELSAPASKITQESYYLVKNDNNVVRVYFYDTHGQSVELEETDIMYEILSESDQKRLDEGIRLSTREQLNKLIMDYES